MRAARAIWFTPNYAPLSQLTAGACDVSLVVLLYGMRK
jgi:hypothetical protein